MSWSDVGRGILGLVFGDRFRVAVEQDMKRYFGVKHLFLVSSGKAALATILRVLASNSSRRKVIIPAYTCFSVPSAVIRAGCKVVLCDVDPHTLDLDFDNLDSLVDSDTLCIVSPHLLGQISDIQRVRSVARPYGIYVIEDAAQAMGGTHKGAFLGTQGDVGLFSLGRGKNVTAGSGGVIVTNSDELAAQLSVALQDVPEPPLTDQIVDVVMVMAMKLLTHPRIYWLPSGLPCLGLGVTKFDPTFPIYRFNGAQAGLLMTWRRRLEQSNAIRARWAQQYRDYGDHELKALMPKDGDENVYLRVPVMMPTSRIKRTLCAFSTREGLGLSALYPTPISEISELKSSLAAGQFPGSQILADCMVTMPAHQYVQSDDVQKICETIRILVREARSGQDHAQPYRQGSSCPEGVTAVSS
jgi:dTDP-4-amino-4,6-dideoxygalactose transaminase